VSSYNNLNSVSRTLASKIWNAIKDDKQLCTIIESEEQISFLSPIEAASKEPKLKEAKSTADTKDEKIKDEKEKEAKIKDKTKISIFLYNITELTSMRNQHQDSQKPPTLLYLDLHYLITPIAESVEDNQILLGKIMQTFAQTPILRGADLQGSLKDSGEELRITLDSLGIDELSKLWTMIGNPYRLCASYTVRPIRIESTLISVEPTKPVRVADILQKDKIELDKKRVIA